MLDLKSKKSFGAYPTLGCLKGDKLPTGNASSCFI